MITLTTSFRTVPNLPRKAWHDEFKRLNSPLSAADIDDLYDATEGYAVALDQAIGETSLRDTDAIRDKNLLRLMDAEGFEEYGKYWHAFSEYMRRIYDPGYKSGVYYPASLGVGGVVPGYDLSLAGYKVIYQGGPRCLSTRGRECANGESYDPNKPMLGASVVADSSAPSINRSIAASMLRYDRWFDQRPPDPGPVPGTGEVVFGRVPAPIWIDRQIPDSNNIAWNNLGQRGLKGLVYHRQVGTNWGTDGWFRLMWYRDERGVLQKGGGQLGLTDFGIDRNSGEILQWNDYLGRGRSGISPNRSGWASGPWENPPGDGRAFVNMFGTNAINRDLVSLEIDGWYDSPISAAGHQKIVALSAYMADQARVRYDSYPLNPNTGVVFTYTHDEYQNHKPCPGQVVLSNISRIISDTALVMRQYQVQA